MARYHFDIMQGGPQQDVDGVECPTMGHARREAVRHVGQLLMTQPGQFWDGATWTLMARCNGIGPVFNLEFRAENILPDEWIE